MFSKADYEKLQQIMQESPEKADLLNRLLDSHKMTLSAISHELRNPLTLIYSTLQLIASKHPEIASTRHWELLLSDVEYMKLLLEELSSYNNSDTLHPKLTDSVSFFREISLSFAASATEDAFLYTSNIPSGLPRITCDRIKLRQVLFNLLGNAKDAVLSCNNPHPEIKMDVCLLDPHHLNITVSDNGCGISSAQMAHIFEPFITYKSGGTGLGLAIADRIVSAHHGNLTVTSTLETGTVFSLTLPIE